MLASTLVLYCRNYSLNDDIFSKVISTVGLIIGHINGTIAQALLAERFGASSLSL